MAGRATRCLGPLAPLLVFLLGALALFTASRAGLAFAYRDRLWGIEGAWWLFPVGWRMDLAATCVVLFLPAVALLVTPARWSRAAGAIVTTALAAVAGAMTFLEVATVPFLAQYDGRPNRIFIDYLSYPREVLGTIWADHQLALATAVVLVALSVRSTKRATTRALSRADVWTGARRLAATPLVLATLVLGMRGTLAHRPANISTAAFSSDHLTNELALDSSYSVGYALYSWRHEIGAENLYGHLARPELLSRVRRAMGLPDDAFVAGDVPLLHRQPVTTPRATPLNLVILLEESLGAQYVGTLGGTPLTPAFDALAREGLLLTNCYATGTRTVRGMEAVVSGFLPTPGSSVVKLGLSQHGFFTVAELLGRAGYSTEFVYGGASNFDNMASFLLGNGFQHVWDEPSFVHPALRGTWGVSDEDLVRAANQRFVAHGDHPFFALLLTTSNHPPYEYPHGRVVPFEEPAPTAHNAVQYADWALGEFFRLAKQEAYFAHTIFLVVADHDTRVWGADLVPIEHFHIPALVLGPGVPVRRFDGLASQVDLLPTVLDLIGVAAEHPMIGHDLLATPPGAPGHAFMQYDTTNAYRVGDDVVIHQAHLPARQFRWRDGHLAPAPLDPELARDALAHATLPELLYRDREYRLPAGVDDARGRSGLSPAR